MNDLRQRRNPARHFLPATAATLVVLAACSDDRLAGKPVTDETTNGLQARLLLPDGAPATAARVRVCPGWYVAGMADSANRTIFADDEGKITIPDLASGDYWFEATRGDLGIRAHLDWNPEAAAVPSKLTLENLASVEGSTSPRSRIRIYGSDRIWTSDAQGRFRIDSVPAGPVDLRVDAGSGSRDSLVAETRLLLRSSDTARVAGLPSLSLEPSTWPGKALFKIDADPGAQSGTLADFPVPVRIGPEQFLSGLRDPGDLRLAGTSGEPIPFEIDEWDSTLRFGLIWARLPVAHPAQGDSIVLLWGKTGLARRDEADVSDSVHAVWHLGESQPLADASGNRNDIESDSGTSPASGILGGARSFTSASLMRAPAPDPVAISRSFTVSCWVNLEGTQRPHAKILDLGSSGEPFGTILLDIDSISGRIGFQMAFADGTWKRVDGLQAAVGWTHVAATWDGSTRKGTLYQNGLLQGGFVSDTTLFPFAGHDLVIGNHEAGQDGPHGTLDEIRLDLRTRSPAWIRHQAFTQTTARISIARVPIQGTTP